MTRILTQGSDTDSGTDSGTDSDPDSYTDSDTDSDTGSGTGGRVCREMLAVPVVKGVKSPSERFAGADDTFTIEALMQNGWALQVRENG